MLKIKNLWVSFTRQPLLLLSSAFFLMSAPIYAADHVDHHHCDRYECAKAFRHVSGKLPPKVLRLLKKDENYCQLYLALKPYVQELETTVANVKDQTTYDLLYAQALALASIVSEGRILITLPDGTVAVDTSKDKTTNTYANFTAKAINENHNSRMAISHAQAWPAGIGVETKFSSTDSQNEAYVAIRLGKYLDSVGTVRISKKI